MRDRHLIIAVVLIVACLLIGEAYVYTFNAEATYNVNSSIDSGKITYTVSSNISNCYDVVISDNGDFRTATEYYLYYDGGYKENVSDVDQPIGSTKLDQSYYLSQLKYQLVNRGVSVKQVDAEGLSEALKTDMTSGSYSKGLIAVSGALPDTVYKGNSDDTILKWIDNGGSLYWVGNFIGSAYATKDAVVPVAADYQMMFLGASNCLNNTDIVKAYSEITTNDYKKSLSLSGHSVKYGVRDGALTQPHLSVGFCQDGYSSITFVKHGAGQICIVAGDYANDQRADLAQIIASHLCYDSEIVAHNTGTVTRGSVTDTVNVAQDSDYYVVYMYLGGYYLEYGRSNTYKSD